MVVLPDARRRLANQLGCRHGRTNERQQPSCAGTGGRDGRRSEGRFCSRGGKERQRVGQCAQSCGRVAAVCRRDGCRYSAESHGRKGTRVGHSRIRALTRRCRSASQAEDSEEPLKHRRLRGVHAGQARRGRHSSAGLKPGRWQRLRGDGVNDSHVTNWNPAAHTRRPHSWGDVCRTQLSDHALAQRSLCHHHSRPRRRVQAAVR